MVQVQSELHNFSWKKLRVKSVDYKNVKKLQQGQDEKPAVFQGRLVEAFKKHSSLEGHALLTKHFIAQSVLDISHKIQKASAGRQPPMNDVFQLAYSVFNTRKLSAKAEHTREISKRPK